VGILLRNPLGGEVDKRVNLLSSTEGGKLKFLLVRQMRRVEKGRGLLIYRYALGLPPRPR
jgi:hypothetical protein